MSVVSADWVVPVEGHPLEDGAVAICDDGRIAAVGPAAELGAGERFADAVILPGLVNAHSHLEYAVYAGFGDGLPFAPWIGIHIERKARLDLDEHGGDRARAGRPSASARASRRSATPASPARPRPPAPSSGLRAIVFLEVFGADERSPSASRRTRYRAVTRSPSGSGSASPPRAVHVLDRALRGLPRLGLPLATHLSESEPRRDGSSPAAAPWASFSDGSFLRSARAGIRALADAGAARPRRVLAAHCVHVPTRRDRAARRARRRRCALSTLERAARLRRRPAGGAGTPGVRVAIATDSPASTPSFDMFEELRPPSSPRGHASATRSARAADALSWRRSAAPGRSASGRDRLAVARQAGRPGRGLTRRLAVLAR